MFPERLARFKEDEWPGADVWERLRAWRVKREAYIRQRDWLHLDFGLWLDAVRATVRECGRVRDRVSRRESSGLGGTE